MPRPRAPQAVAEATGADVKNPGRYAGRATPKTDALGAPPDHLDEDQAQCWMMFASEMPWLGASDRTLVELAAKLRSRMRTDPDMGVNAMAQLRLCLSSMGATPADRSKVMAPDDESEDQADQYFN